MIIMFIELWLEELTKAAKGLVVENEESTNQDAIMEPETLGFKSHSA